MMPRSALLLIDPPSDPQALAEAVGRGMYSVDPASQNLGAEIVSIGPGECTMTMKVRREMLNGHQTCHGGFIFAFADSTFAFACNSRNLNTVAAGCTIDYLAPAFEDEILTSHAKERSLAGRTGIYDVTVTNQAGKAIALFRGRSYRIKGQVIGQAPEV